MTIRQYRQEDLPAITAIWNEVVEEGNAFPQDEPLDEEQGAAFFASQSYTGVAEEDGTIYGLYILHPNNVGHDGNRIGRFPDLLGFCDAWQGRHIGEQLVKDCLTQGRRLGFRVLQFNAVVESNIHARHLYERLGFTQLGTITGGFRMKDGSYVNICPYYREL